MIFKQRKLPLKKSRKETPEIFKARRELEQKNNCLLKYFKKIKKGKYIRYMFYEIDNINYIYIALSEEERREVTSEFNRNNEKKGYEYKDSFKMVMHGSDVQHRFYNKHDCSIMFMTDDGIIWR